MMKLDKMAGSKNDEFYTPMYAVEPLIKHIKRNGFKRIWCPFDTESSNFVKLKQEGFDVVATHISTGGDFFTIDTPDCDCIISNPPYSVKGEVLERLFAIGKPFAMLVGLPGLFESQKRFTMFANSTFEIMYLNLRVSYLNTEFEKVPSINPPFPSVYITSKFLDKQICFERINKKLEERHEMQLWV